MSNKRFFSSDYHFFHDNIRKYCNRPFNSVEEMNEIIIKRHNERVKKTDEIYFLGDFGFFASRNRAFRGEGQPFDPTILLNQMNGKWHMIMGNHDKTTNKLNIRTKEIILHIGGMDIQLIHNPTYAKIDYPLILVGHVHVSWLCKELNYCGKTSLMINVGVDKHEFYPWEWRELQTIYDRWKRLRETKNYEEIGKFFERMNK